MAEDLNKIPAPSKDAQSAWLRTGAGDNKLVWDSKAKRWKVVKNADVKGAVTFEQWSATNKPGQSSTDVNVSQNAPSYITKQAREKDPLGQYIIQSGLTVTSDNNKIYVTDKDGNINYLYVDSDGAFSYSSDYDAIRRKVIVDYQSRPGGINSLFDLLYKKNLISKQTFDTKNISAVDFASGLQYTINSYGVDILNKREFNKQFKPNTLDEFLGSNVIPGGKSGPSTAVDKYITLRQDADEQIDRFMMARLSRNATAEEKEEYFNTLNKAEKNAFQKTTQTEGGVRTGTGSLITELDRELMMGKIAGSALAGSDLETILKGGGEAAQEINSVKTYASKYGIYLDDNQAMGYIADNYKTGKDIDATKAKIQKLSKIKYSNLADVLDDDTTLEDIASDFKYTYSQLTGDSSDSIKLDNPIIQKALTNNGAKGVMNKNDFEYLIRTSPETQKKWLNSPGAKEEASAYALNILRAFGLMA